MSVVEERAHRIASDAEALEVADAFATRLAEGAAERDRQRRLPRAATARRRPVTD